jgi:ABC-type polysaccharide/polyol phosphate transport system ATPase subunit
LVAKVTKGVVDFAALAEFAAASMRTYLSGQEGALLASHWLSQSTGGL